MRSQNFCVGWRIRKKRRARKREKERRVRFGWLHWLAFQLFLFIYADNPIKIRSELVFALRIQREKVCRKRNFKIDLHWFNFCLRLIWFEIVKWDKANKRNWFDKAFGQVGRKNEICCDLRWFTRDWKLTSFNLKKLFFLFVTETNQRAIDKRTN